MSKLQEQLDAQNIAENKRQWKRNAAEEMYEALKALLNGGSEEGAPGERAREWDKAEAALAKAEGRQT